ncbi:FAD-dependent oxidoreductase [Desulfovibrio sulfodismutans]|uniref:FAD-dependent oxidoreductase n=1 Tax=Desulfolutivibrio sulfodismutans TaxID=63561 RepID=A0A7K3NP73_9BACT|nr:FAD-dependent oxidoreductase [Desulfolutivibrio sulfodismutans]NDY57970.1 FAD-dependent oxidoreductase [Desulfolutivibrio sulfodismutans]QLA14107.1 thioredoxin reductase [Desulfolutivibrio sulfodismutans DSM 3696]
MSPFSDNKSEEKAPSQSPPTAGDTTQDAAGVSAPSPGDDWFLPQDTRRDVLRLFEKLSGPVALEVFTAPGQNAPYNDYLLKFLRDLSRLDERIQVKAFALSDDAAKTRGVDFSPTLLFSPDDLSIRYLGAPLGEEVRTFMEVLLRVSARQSGLSEPAKKRLAALKDPRRVTVFVNPACPYCPGQVLNAFRCAIERPDLVAAACIDAAQHTEAATARGVGSVPHTIIEDPDGSLAPLAILGLEPEDRFVAELASMQSAPVRADATDTAPGHDHAGDVTVKEVDVVVVGAGPAGLTAGMYAARGGMTAVVLEKAVIGGQVTVTPQVENYPGFATVPGGKLMEMVAAQTRQYVPVIEGAGVDEIKIGRRIEVDLGETVYLCRAVILATGATWRKLGIPGEDRYFGRGVSACAACDGYLYKDAAVAVVGGGNTALTEALHLARLGATVTIIHRRDAFRAEKHLVDALEKEGVEVVWNTVVEEVLGDDAGVTAVRLKNMADGSTRELAVRALFVAVGYIPVTGLAQDIGLALDEAGYIKVDAGMRTSIPRVYACGDVTGGVRQIVTAVGQGATAALSAFEDISHPYWKK